MYPYDKTIITRNRTLSGKLRITGLLTPAPVRREAGAARSRGCRVADGPTALASTHIWPSPAGPAAPGTTPGASRDIQAAPRPRTWRANCSR